MIGRGGEPPPDPGPPPPPEPPPEEPDRGIGWGMLLGLALLAAAGAGIAAFLLVSREDEQERATRAGRTATATTGTAPATTAAATSSLTLPVPNVTGRRQDEAVATLEGRGLEPLVERVAGPPPAGVVLAQDPASGAGVEQGASVRLRVSDGSGRGGATTSTVPATAPETPASAEVPELSGDLRQALQAIQEAELLAAVSYVPGDAPLGTVLAQHPAPGARAPAGTEVTVNVSDGPGERELRAVPDVRGRTTREALAALNDAGLRLVLLRRPVDDPADAGRIVAQTPSAGTRAPDNAQVLVYLGTA